MSQIAHVTRRGRSGHGWPPSTIPPPRWQAGPPSPPRVAWRGRVSEPSPSSLPGLKRKEPATEETRFQALPKARSICHSLFDACITRLVLTMAERALARAQEPWTGRSSSLARKLLTRKSAKFQILRPTTANCNIAIPITEFAFRKSPPVSDLQL